MFSILVLLLNACGPRQKPSRRQGLRTGRMAPHLEILESRFAPAMFTVTNTDSSGNGSFAAALAGANSSTQRINTINFATGVSGTITETPPAWYISTDSDNPVTGFTVNITGPGSDTITIAGPTTGDPVLTIFSNATVNITGITLTNSSGRAIYNAGTLTLGGDVITGCSNNWSGGGVYNDTSGNLTVSNCTFTTNWSGDDGGAIQNMGTASINGSTFSWNACGNNGGAINNQGTLSLTNCTINNGNQAQANGGGIWTNGPFTMSGGSISGNTAAGNGGGIYSAGDTASLENVAIEGNSAVNGGGFFANAGTFGLTDCTLTGNTASGNGPGGVWVAGSASYYPSGGTLTDTVFEQT